MKRREFLGAVGASLSLAITPLPALSGPAGLAKRAGVATTRTPQMMYGWAVVYAQMNEGVSPAKLAKVFRMSSADANILYDKMLSRGALLPPGADGIARASKPWRPWEKRANKERRDKLRNAFDRVMSPVLKDPSFGWRSRQDSNLQPAP